MSNSVTEFVARLDVCPQWLTAGRQAGCYKFEGPCKLGWVVGMLYPPLRDPRHFVVKEITQGWRMNWNCSSSTKKVAAFAATLGVCGSVWSTAAMRGNGIIDHEVAGTPFPDHSNSISDGFSKLHLERPVFPLSVLPVAS